MPRLDATEGNDPEVLAMVGERARVAAEDLWEINNIVGCSRPLEERPQALEDAWWADRRGTPELHHATYTLPTLALAAEAAATDPHGALTGAGQRWIWCRHQAGQISDDLMTWVREHEKDVVTVSTPEENGTGAHTVSSQPEEPQEAANSGKEPLDAMAIHYRVRESFRPLVTLCDPDYLIDRHGVPRVDRVEDAARLARSSHDELRAFEDSGKDCVLSEATGLLWWAESVQSPRHQSMARSRSDLRLIWP